MNPRQETILKLIVDEYIRSAEPVGSKFLSERHGMDVSPATIRNAMAELESEGYLVQPHTSAGRVPTEKAFVYYLQHFVEPERGGPGQSRMRAAVDRDDSDQAMKTLAKTMVDLSGETAIVAFGSGRSYMTGVANLFQKPEFSDLQMMQSLSAMLDRFDEVVCEMFDAVRDDPQVMIGSENPFGKDMAAIVVKCRLPSNQIGFIGLVGPMRMDYAKNIGLIERAKEIIDEAEDV